MKVVRPPSRLVILSLDGTLELAEMGLEVRTSLALEDAPLELSLPLLEIALELIGKSLDADTMLELVSVSELERPSVKLSDASLEDGNGTISEVVVYIDPAESVLIITTPDFVA